MPRNGEQVRKRLQWAALELFRERGYEKTTAAEIAANAGVTERTFFRHFPDKREVLFSIPGTKCFRSVAYRRRHCFKERSAAVVCFRVHSVKQMFVENRPFTEPRQRMIASSPALRERATDKNRALIAAVASALCERGLTVPQANLASQMGMATLSHGVSAWFRDGSIDLGEHIVRAFQEARDLSSSNVPTAVGTRRTQRAREKAKLT